MLRKISFENGCQSLKILGRQPLLKHSMTLLCWMLCCMPKALVNPFNASCSWKYLHPYGRTISLTYGIFIFFFLISYIFQVSHVFIYIKPNCSRVNFTLSKCPCHHKYIILSHNSWFDLQRRVNLCLLIASFYFPYYFSEEKNLHCFEKVVPLHPVQFLCFNFIID